MRFSLVGMPLAATALSLLLGAAPAAASPAPDCDRACLKGHADQFLQALLKHDPASLALADGFTAIHNGKPTKLGEDEVWKVIDKIDFRQYVMDPSAGQVAFFGVLNENHKRGTLFLRLTVRGGKLVLAETITGERVLDGVPGLVSPNPFYDYVLPKPERRSREQLIAIANSYFEGLERHDGSKVPVSADCRRFEDGVQTTLNAVFLPLTCNDFRPFTYMDKTANRLYPIVDVERGLVLGQMVIQVSKAAGPPSAAASSGSPPGGAAGGTAGATAGAAAGAPSALVPSAVAMPYRPNPATGLIMPANEFRNKPHDTIIHELFKIVDGRITEIQTIRLDRPYGWGGGWN